MILRMQAPASAYAAWNTVKYTVYFPLIQAQILSRSAFFTSCQVQNEDQLAVQTSQNKSRCHFIKKLLLSSTGPNEKLYTFFTKHTHTDLPWSNLWFLNNYLYAACIFKSLDSSWGSAQSMLISNALFHTFTPRSSQVQPQSATVAPLSHLTELLINCLAQGQHVKGKTNMFSFHRSFFCSSVFPQSQSSSVLLKPPGCNCFLVHLQ